MEVIMANNINTLVSSTNGVQSGATIVGRNNDTTISNLNKASSIYSGSSRQRTTQASNESLNRTASLYSGSRRSMYDDNNNTSNSSSVTLPEPDENLFNEFMSTVAPYVKMSDEEKNYYYQISSQITANGGDASSWAQDFLSTNAIANVLGVSRSEVNQNRSQLLNYYLGIEDNKPLDFTTGATLINSINQGRRQQEEAGLQEDLINLYKRGYDDNSPEVQQIVKKILQKEQEMSYFEDSNPRMWTTEWAKNSLSQLAYMGVGTLVGTAGGIVGGLIGNTVFGPAGGVKGFQIGSGLARFLTYDKQFEASAFWNMKQAGVSTETALKYSNIDGFINGLNEAFLDVGYSQVMGGVGKLAGVADLGGKIVPTIVSRVAKDGTLAGWLGSLLLYMGLDATGEFVQESTQSLTSSALQAIAEATDGLPYSNNVRDALSSAWEEGIQGFATGLFFSGFGSGINVLADIKKTSKLKNNSIHSYSQEAYVNNQENRNLVKSLKLGGSELSEDNVTNLLKKLYDSTQKVRDDIKSGIRKDLFEQLKTIDGSLNENVLDGADITTNEIKDVDGNVISGKKTEVKRKSDGSTYFVVDKEDNTTEDSKEHYTMRIANPNVVGTSRLGEIYVDAKTAEYNNELLNDVKTSPKALSMEQAGAISFTLDGETKTLTIESVNVQDDNASLKEQAIRDLMEMYSDYSIEWNNRTQSDNAVFSSIESSNPRNTSTNTYGLNYTDNSKTTEEQSDRAYVRRWLGTSFSEDASENDFMATILQGAAKARGLSGQEFIEKYFTEIRESENKDANVKGYTRTSRDELSKQVKATIYAGKSADPTTFLHELNHAIILMGDNRKEFTSIFNKVKGTKQFMSFVKSNMDILRYVIGKTDDKGVYVLENGKYVVDEAKLQSLFQNGENWTRDDFEFEARLYEAYMRSGQTLNPTLTGFFRRVAETFRRVYTALRNGISSSNLNDEIVAYFDKLYGYDSSTGTTSVLNDSGELHNIGELKQEKDSRDELTFDEEGLLRYQSVRNYLYKKFGLQKNGNTEFLIHNKDQNTNYRLSKTSLNKMLSKKATDKSYINGFSTSEHNEAVSNVKELFENAILKTRESDKKNSPDMKDIERFEVDFSYNGEENRLYTALFTAKRYADSRVSNGLYSIELVGIKIAPSTGVENPTIVKLNHIRGFSEANNNVSFNDNIASDSKSVKGDALSQTQDDISNLSAIEQYDAIKKQYYGTDKYMIAPNGKATKLTEEQWIQVRTPNFIKWFGDWINDPQNASKVVDKNGEPLVVYHGTRRFGFDTFNDRQNKMSDAPYGSYWFTSDRDVAHSYSGTDEVAKIESPYTNDEDDIGLNDNPGNYACFLSIKDPMVRDFNWNSFDGVGETEEDSLGINANDVVDEVKTEGKHDGVILSHIYDEGGLYDVFSAGTDYVVFNPNQIKSATENNGEFSTESDSILYQEAYHGSGSLFEAFNKEFINTGTQAQDYGYGFYFSNEEEVAEGYAHALTRTQENINEDISFLEKRIDSLKASIKGLKNEISNLEDTDSERYKEAYNEEYAKTEKGIQRYKDNPNSFFLKRYANVESIESFVKDKLAKNIERQKNQLAEKENALSNAESELNNLKNEKPREGHLYKVNIPDKGFISWDKTISWSLWNRIINEFNSQYPDKELGVGITTGEVLNQYLTKALGSQKEAADFLSGLGIVGYKYSITDPFGKLSKAEKRATNYVVFDDKNITDVSALFQTEVEDAQQELAKKFSKSFVLGSNKQFATESEEQAIKEIVYNYPKKHVIDGVYMLKGLLDDKHDLPMKKEFLTSRLVNIITGKDMILLPRFMDRMLNAIIGEQRFDNYSLSDGISAVSTDGKTFEFKLVKNQKNAVTKLNDALKKADVGVVILSSKGSLDRFDKAKISKKGEALVINIYDAKNIEVLKKTTSNEWRLVRPDSKSELKLNNLSSIESIASELQKIKPENQDKMDYAIYSAENEQEVKKIERKTLEQETQSDLSDKLMRLASNGIATDSFNTSANASEQYNTVRNKYYGTAEWLKAPNGKDTRLTEEQWIQVRTPNFINYFGDWINDPDNASKVVDENGEPLPVFHGTPNANFDIFHEKRRGIYFTSDVENANSYAITNNGGTYSTFLKMTNPLTIDAEGSKWSSIRFKEEKDYRKLLNTKNITPSDLATYVGSNTDYDGVFIKNVLDGTTVADDYIVFNSTQIKSATDNNGEFSTESDSILLQTAYHGSPNEIIGELSTKYMGSGEGHQIHGWGLYFAQDQNISKERYISRLAERKDEDILSFDGKEITIEDYYGAFPFMATKEFHPYWKESLNKSLHEDTERKELITRERAQAKEELKKEKHSVSLIETILANPSSKEALEARKKIDFVPSGDISEGAIKTLKLALDGHRELVAYYEKGLDLLKRIEKNPEKLKISNPSRPSLFINGEEISSYTGSEIEAIYGIIIGYSLENNLVKKHEGEVSFSSGLNRKLEDKYYQEYFKSVFDKGELVPLVEKILESGNFVDEAKILDVAKSIKSVEVNAPVFGSLLTVDIPENEVLLDEQKRFYNQSSFVQNALKRLYANEFGIEPKEDWRGDGIYSNIQAQIAKKTQSYDDLPKQASLMLAKYGVEGITYVGETDGRCFVIFTDEAIKKVDSRLYQIGDSEWTETAKRIAYEASSLEDFFKKYREQVEDGNIELDNANVSQLLTSIYDEAESEAYDPTIEGYFDEEDSSSLIDEDWAVEEVERPIDEESMASSSTTSTMSDEVPDWFDLTEEEIASLNKDAETTETNTQELEKNISEVQKVVVDADLPKGLSLDHSRSLDTSSHARAIEFANILKGSKEATIEFLKTLREVNNEFFYNNGAEYNEAVNEESYQAKTIRESAFNNFKNMSKFIQNLVYESKGSQYRNLDKITDRAWKIVAGQVSANPDVYMDLYSRASGNTEWSGENSIEARVLSEIGLTERDWNDLSYSKRKEYIQYIEDKDIRKRILTGDVKDVDLRGYIERTEKRAEASLSEAKALEESQKYIIDENKKTILKLGTEAQNYQKQLAEIEKEKAEIQEKLERNVKSMENKLKNSNMDTSNTLVHADLLKKMTELNRREAQYQKALKMWQKGSTTVTQEDLTRIKGLIEDARAKIEELQKAEEITPEEAIKRLQNLYNAWKDAKTKETIDKLKDKYNVRLTNLRQTKNEAIVETRKRYMQIMKERETLRRIRSEKERLIKQIMKAPSANIAREEARQIKALQLLIDPAFRRGTIKALDGKVYTVAELKAMLTKNSDDPVIQTLTERQIERLTKTSLDEMTLSEVEDTYRYIKSLREEGLNKRRSEIIQRKAETQIIYNELTNALMESKNFADYGFEGTEDKKARLNTKSGKVRNAWYQTLNMARKAQILDNNEKGTFYNLLIRKKRTLQAEEMKALSKRANLIQDTIKANNIDTDSLYKTWTMNLEDGRTVTFTTSELAYIYLSQYCQENREALAYGTFVSIDEKSTFQKSADSVIIGQGKSLIEARENKVNDDIRRLGDWRYNEALSLAKTVIEGDKGIYNLVKAIESDLNSSDFQRVIDLTRKIYNVDIKKEDYYLPLNRTDFLGKDPGEDIKNDLLNTVPGTRGVVDKGFTKERNKTISPLHQKAIKYDLFKVWTESVKKQEHFIAMQEYINQLNSLFVDGDKAKLLRSRIENTYGKTMLENLDEYIKEVANPDAGALQQDPAKDILNAAKGNIYAAYLGFKLSSITNQLITSPAAFLGKVSPIRLASNLLQMIVHYKDISEKVFELSPFMKSRNFDLIAGEIKESAENLGLSKAQRGWNKVLEFGLKGLEFADQFSVVAGWKAIFDQELERLGGETEENIRTASAIADEYVYETQPLSDKSEIAPLFKNKSAFTNIMLQFQTSLNVVWNNLAYDTVQDFRKKNWRKAVGTVVGYAMAGSLLALAHGEFKPDDDDDEDEKLKKFWMKFGYSVLSQGVESIPIFSNVVDPIFKYIVTDEKPSYTSNMITPFPFIANASEATKYTVQAIREKDTEALTKALDKGADAFMLALGLPYSGLRELQAIQDVGIQALLGERK